MRIHAVLNRGGGTLSTMDLDALSARLREVMTRAGHDTEVRIVDGAEIVGAIRDACAHPQAEIVLAGGGDGTVSLAAGLLAGSQKVLAILPAGTMNLFARSLGIPLDIDAAMLALAYGRIRNVDIARVNGRPFVHQFSIGMHPQLIHLRSRMPFHGRIGKLLASARAALATFRNPHNMEVALTFGNAEMITTTSGIGITNNLFGEGHLPYADKPDGGVLGIYIMRAEHRSDLLSFFVNMGLGRWRRNDQVEIHEAEEVHLKILSASRQLKNAIDGELCPLERDIHVALQPGSLRVLVV
ncbi:diacylglycerol kinase family protein [Chelativorans sp. AA-79]|uniref:diacylglycerol/lipid kinase family protein n=1 Tax=Chelativorans sp. AA-79 TaxID=3028735 RepID=UPI0023F7FDEA|nr:diacylglycerol kinase family protein [Chelativorans sp. AA-79]WEX10046.1 diacylglycerol kinase family protein [Chelativorans sp. AA-79]